MYFIYIYTHKLEEGDLIFSGSVDGTCIPFISAVNYSLYHFSCFL